MKYFQELNSGYDEMLKCLRELQEELQVLKRKYLPPEVDTWPNFALESQGETVETHRCPASTVGGAEWGELIRTTSCIPA